VYRIASVSKPVTSIAIMNLVEKGKLNLTDTVFGYGKLLGDCYYLDVISDQRIYNITVRNLMEHSAGWNRSQPMDGFDHNDAPFFPMHVTEVEDAPNPVGDTTLIRFSLRRGLQYDPGTAYAYSNVGFLILGKIIESVTGVSYEQFVDSCILKPLAITDFHLGKNLESEKLPGEVVYHSKQHEQSVYGTGEMVLSPYGGFNLEAMNAHGGWVTSAPSLVKILTSLKGFGDSPSILTQESVELMGKPSTVNSRYGLGWAIGRSGSLYHTGSLEGTAAFVCNTPDGFTWAFLLNSRSNSSAEFWKAFDRLPWKCLEIIKRENTSPQLQETIPVIELPASVATIY